MLGDGQPLERRIRILALFRLAATAGVSQRRSKSGFGTSEDVRLPLITFRNEASVARPSYAVGMPHTHERYPDPVPEPPMPVPRPDPEPPPLPPDISEPPTA